METFLTTTNLFWPLAGIMATLIGLIWNSLSKRLSDLEQTQRDCPVSKMPADMAEMKNDIKWIKGYLFKGDKGGEE